MANSPFFPDYETFRTWAQGIPGVFPCHEDPEDPRLADPEDPCYPITEGPYYVAPEYLLLRVGTGESCRYNVLVRVSREAEADYRWYVPATQPGHGQDGEIIFAASLWDHHEESGKIVGGVTLREARAALDTFLATKSGRTRLPS